MTNTCRRMPLRVVGALALLSALAVLLCSCEALLEWTDTPTAAPSAVATAAPGAGEPFLLAMLDVGQGDSLLLGSDGHYMLVDAGDNTRGGDVLRALANRGVTRLDAVVGTHPDSDHIGGLDTVIDGIDVGAVYMDGVQSNTKTYEDLLDAIGRKHLTVTVPRPGDKLTLGEAQITFLWPPKGLDDALDNDHSIVLRFAAAGHTALLTGDIEKRAEKELLQSGADVSCDILKVAHHGSSGSSSQEFLQAAQPAVALIGVGAGNDYGHPTAVVLRRLDAIGAQVYRTDRNGAVMITVVDGKLKIQTEKGGAAAK